MQRFPTRVVLAGLISLLVAFATHPLPADGVAKKTERFDKEPNWEGYNNRVKVEKPNPVVQGFGFSATHHAGGKRMGEIGGRVQRCTTPATYLKRLETTASFEQRLHCSGTFTVTETMGMSSLYFGFCNTQTMETRPRNFLGLMINGEGGGCEVHVSYNTSGGQSDGFRATGTGPKGAQVRDFNLIPVNTPYTWDLLYDPQANAGIGEITFTLGGQGPFTGGPFTFKLPPAQRQAGATFDAFGIVNAQSAGNWLTMYFDDITVHDQLEHFDVDPTWQGDGNRARLEDHGVEGAHQFGFSDTHLAGGERGEVGGVLYSSPSVPGYYADRVGALSLEQPLVASGRLALKQYGSDGGLYIGWFNSRKRGYPPENILGVLIDGPTSTGPRFRGCAASSDSKIGHVQRDTAPPLAPNGTAHTWKMEYDPQADGGRGRLTVWLDDRHDAFTLPAALRQVGAVFDRFGLFVHEGGGRVSRIYLDDLEYSAE